MNSAKKWVYSLVEENIVLRTGAQGSPDAVHISLGGELSFSNFCKTFTHISFPLLTFLKICYPAFLLHDKFAKYINYSQQGFLILPLVTTLLILPILIDWLILTWMSRPLIRAVPAEGGNKPVRIELGRKSFRIRKFSFQEIFGIYEKYFYKYCSNCSWLVFVRLFTYKVEVTLN